MSEQQPQVSKMAGALVEHQRAFEVMPTEDRQWVIMNTVTAIGLFAEAVKNRSFSAVKKLLEFVKTVSLPAIGTFVVADKLRPGKTIDGIEVGWLGDNIKKYFLSKIEKNVVAAEELKVSKLLKGSRDPAIITEFGGEEKVEITFGQYWEFLKTADQNSWYVAYIRDVWGVLWAVDGGWDDGGWDFEADPLGSPDRWGAGVQFLSR